MSGESVKWIILNPNGDGYSVFDSFEGAMKLFEGFNSPRLVMLEPIHVSIARAKDEMKRRRPA